MQNVDFEKEDTDVKISRPIKPEVETKSFLAGVVAKTKITKTQKGAEIVVITTALLIILVSIFIFMYGMGKRELNEVSETGNVHLETDFKEENTDDLGRLRKNSTE